MINYLCMLLYEFLVLVSANTRRILSKYENSMAVTDLKLNDTGGVSCLVRRERDITGEVKDIINEFTYGLYHTADQIWKLEINETIHTIFCVRILGNSAFNMAKTCDVKHYTR